MVNIPYMDPMGDSKALALTTIFYAFKTAFLTPNKIPAPTTVSAASHNKVHNGIHKGTKCKFLPQVFAWTANS